MILFGLKKEDIVIKLPDNVMSYGFISNKEELAALYSRADVFVNCSREDSLSLINCESQACGTPAVTYDNTGIKETVMDESFSILSGNYQALFQKTMHILLSKESKSLGTKVRDYVMSQFEANKSCRAYLLLYETIARK